MRWLVVGALNVEIQPLIWRLSSLHRLSRRLQVGSHPHQESVKVAILRCGVGPAMAQRHTTKALQQWRPDAVLNMGTCGALVDTLQIGDICTVEGTFRDTCPAPDLRPLAGHPVATLSTVDQPCWTSERRTELALAGAQVVEMEAVAVATATHEFDPDLPVHALKIVSDQAGSEPDPVIGSHGNPSPLRIARFKFRALKLSHQRLVPSILPVLSRLG